ncbi:hypothetical protein LTR53_012984 [Teratosphaeriaceae sp. CCFEE 6253]|nr:hypothetical protein LTR53_012984 [Teratosphaeriaceae sp. CCFEE 6253]
MLAEIGRSGGEQYLAQLSEWLVSGNVGASGDVLGGSVHRPILDERRRQPLLQNPPPVPPTPQSDHLAGDRRQRQRAKDSRVPRPRQVIAHHPAMPRWDLHHPGPSDRPFLTPSRARRPQHNEVPLHPHHALHSELPNLARVPKADDVADGDVAAPAVVPGEDDELAGGGDGGQHGDAPGRVDVVDMRAEDVEEKEAGGAVGGRSYGEVEGGWGG